MPRRQAAARNNNNNNAEDSSSASSPPPTSTRGGRGGSRGGRGTGGGGRGTQAQPQVTPAVRHPSTPTSADADSTVGTINNQSAVSVQVLENSSSPAINNNSNNEEGASAGTLLLGAAQEQQQQQQRLAQDGVADDGNDDDEEEEEEEEEDDNNNGGGRWIHLNVGGSDEVTTRQTLLSATPGSLLHTYATTNFAGVPRDEHGRVFLDRDPRVFRHVLNHLRGYPPMCKQGEAALVAEEACFFGLPELARELGASVMSTSNNSNINGNSNSNNKKKEGQVDPAAADDETSVPSAAFFAGPGISPDACVLSSSMIVAPTTKPLFPSASGTHTIRYKIEKCTNNSELIAFGIASGETLAAMGGGPQPVGREAKQRIAALGGQAGPGPFAATFVGRPDTVSVVHTGEVVTCFPAANVHQDNDVVLVTASSNNNSSGSIFKEGDMVEISVEFGEANSNSGSRGNNNNNVNNWYPSSCVHFSKVKKIAAAADGANNNTNKNDSDPAFEVTRLTTKVLPAYLMRKPLHFVVAMGGTSTVVVEQAGWKE